MKLVNSSVWNTKQLRAVLNSIIVFSSFPKEKLRYLEIENAKKTANTYNMNNAIHGTAYRWEHRINIRIPIGLFIVAQGSDGLSHKEWQPLDELNPEQTKVVARVLLHELDHLRGLDHKDMINWWDADVDFVGERTIMRKPIKEIKVLPKVDLVEKRKAKAIIMLEKIEKKLTQLEKLKVKWERKVKYYVKEVKP